MPPALPQVRRAAIGRRLLTPVSCPAHRGSSVAPGSTTRRVVAVRIETASAGFPRHTTPDLESTTMSTNRREFLRQAAGSAAVLAGMTATTRGFFANETVNVGCIGTGGRCRHLMRALAGIQGVRVTAVCDVWDVNLAEGKKLADPAATTSRDFRQLLDRSDVDAVLVATPDHWHVPITVAACAAGKDVYVEKPLTHDLAEGPAAIEAQNRHQRIVQVGTQQRSMPHIQKAREILKSGQLGEIDKVHLTWNRNTPRWSRDKQGVDPTSVDWKQFLGGAKQQPFDEYRFRHWRWFWDFGGGILTDLMVHWLDVAHWFLDLEHPESGHDDR